MWLTYLCLRNGEKPFADSSFLNFKQFTFKFFLTAISFNFFKFTFYNNLCYIVKYLWANANNLFKDEIGY